MPMLWPFVLKMLVMETRMQATWSKCARTSSAVVYCLWSSITGIGAEDVISHDPVEIGTTAQFLVDK